MPENKTKAIKQSVSAFLDAVEDETRRKDAKAVAKLMADITGEKATMWGVSIVGFGSYHYKYDSGREGDMPLVGFSPRKANLVLYVMPGFKEYEKLLAKLGKHKIGKSCLYLNKLADIDAAVLRELITRSVAHMRRKWNRPIPGEPRSGEPGTHSRRLHYKCVRFNRTHLTNARVYWSRTWRCAPIREWDQKRLRRNSICPATHDRASAVGNDVNPCAPPG